MVMATAQSSTYHDDPVDVYVYVSVGELSRRDTRMVSLSAGATAADAPESFETDYRPRRSSSGCRSGVALRGHG